MDDAQVERSLAELKKKLYVNLELKRELRGELEEQARRDLHADSRTDSRSRQNRRNRWRPLAAAALALSLIVAGSVWFHGRGTPHVEAAALHVRDQFSLMEQLGAENSSGMAEHEGTIYVPLPDRGLYAYDEQGFYPLVAGPGISFVRSSSDGTRLVYVRNGSLYLYELGSAASRLLLDRGSGRDAYGTPTWSPDGKRILYVVAADGGEGRIEELNLADGSTRIVAQQGAYPTYMPGSQTILYERSGTIVSQNLRDGTTRTMASGRYPAVSGDGAYVAYIKTDGDDKLQDVWIADADFKTAKQLTKNTLADAWDRQTGKPIEGKQQPRYSFEQPVWSSDGTKLYVYKVFSTNVQWKKLSQFEMAAAQATPEQIVAASIRALIYRDEDYAHSFFSYDPGYLKGTSPRQVGYRIVGSGQLGGRTYVDADTYLSYADPYYQISTTRYWLTDADGGAGYLIDGMDSLGEQVITIAGGVVRSEQQEQPARNLFTVADVPTEAGWTNGAVYNLVYRPEADTVFFTMARSNGAGTKLVLMQYEGGRGQFAELAAFEGVDSSSLMIFDPQFKYAAIEAAINGVEDTVVYDLGRNVKHVLSAKLKGEAATEVHTRLWEDGILTYYAQIEGRDVFFAYDPERG